MDLKQCKSWPGPLKDNSTEYNLHFGPRVSNSIYLVLLKVEAGRLGYIKYFTKKGFQVL